MINTNNVNTYTINTSSNPRSINTSPNPPESMDNKDINKFRDEFVVENKKNGLIEKFYNFCKNKTGLGIGSKKVEQKIAEFENGKSSEKEVKNKISDYKASQKNAEQHFGDFASAMIAIPVYFKWTDSIKKLNAKMEVESYGPVLSSIKTLAENKELMRKGQTGQKEVKGLKKLVRQIGDKITIPEIKKFVSSKKAKVAILPLAMLLGGITKWAVLKLNRIGSKEFKVENKEQLDKKELKKVKKGLNRKRHKENFKNFCTGALNGLLAPITAIAGGIAGVPAYILTTSGIRFLTNKNDNKEKSLNNYGAILKNNIALNSLFALALAAPIYKKAKYSAVLDANLEKVVKNLKDTKLKNPKLPSAKTAFGELQDIMFKSPKIKKIFKNVSSEIIQKVKNNQDPDKVNKVFNKSINKFADKSIIELSKENIFAVKFLQVFPTIKFNPNQPLESQISAKVILEMHSRLIENCPPSRTMGEAQKEINKLLNSKKYKVSKLLGVGTIAETYLAKDQSGKEVCIKILKKGINTKKIKKDKEAFIKLVTKSAPKRSQQYLIKNIENMAEALSKEVNFENEMQAANKLRKSTTKADVVLPIEAKPGIYIMEKAPGISLDTLAKYYKYKFFIKQEEHSKSSFAQERIAIYKKEIKKLKAKSPDFDNFDLSANEIKTLLYNYIEVLTEQFTKVDKNGKTLHADIHPGNIFINLDVLKNKTNNSKDKLFTLLDTGNTIDLTKEQAVASLKLTSYIKNGNVKDITKYVLDGAVLPKKLSPEKAMELVEQDLSTIFYDSKTNINTMHTDELFNLTNNILRKHNIIPNDTQLNRYKAKVSAHKSLGKLTGSFFNQKEMEFDYNKKKLKKNEIDKITKKHEKNTAKEVLFIIGKYKAAQTLQENKNLTQMSLKEIIANSNNPNNLKTNSEEYLTYQFKQDIGKYKDIGYDAKKRKGQ